MVKELFASTNKFDIRQNKIHLQNNLILFQLLSEFPFLLRERIV